MARRLKYQPGHWRALEYPDDVAMIVAALRDVGLAVSPSEAADMWNTFCEDTYAAGWLTPTSAEWVVRALTEDDDA